MSRCSDGGRAEGQQGSRAVVVGGVGACVCTLYLSTTYQRGMYSTSCVPPISYPIQMSLMSLMSLPR